MLDHRAYDGRFFTECEGPAIMRRAPITRPVRNVLSRRASRAPSLKEPVRVMPHARGALLRSYPKRLAKIGWRIGLTARWPPACRIGTMSIRRYGEWPACRP